MLLKNGEPSMDVYQLTCDCCGKISDTGPTPQDCLFDWKKAYWHVSAEKKFSTLCSLECYDKHEKAQVK